MQFTRRPPRLALTGTLTALALGLGLAACENADTRTWQKTADGDWVQGEVEREGIFGKGGLDLFGTGRADKEGGSGSGIGVNAFLWRASLNTMAFMPLASADPFGGVIITDWYQPDGTPGERFKVNVYILGTQLRSDGVKVSVFRQIRQGADWVDAPTASDMATELENAILLSARELRMARASTE